MGTETNHVESHPAREGNFESVGCFEKNTEGRVSKQKDICRDSFVLIVTL